MTGASLSPSVAWLLTALSDARLDVGESARIQRPVLNATHLLLPGGDYAMQRAAVAHAAGHLLFSPTSLKPSGLKPLSVAVVSAVEDARVDSLMIRRYPGMRAWVLPILREAVQPDGLSFAALISRMSLALLDEEWQDDNHWVNKARQMFSALTERLEDYAEVRRLASILANDLGQMRVRFDLHNYCVPARYRDDNSYLWEFGANDSGEDEEPLELPSEAPPAPPSAPSQSVADTSQQLTMYPEWDYRLERLREDWCTVVEQPVSMQFVDTSTLTARNVHKTVGRLALKARAELSRDGRLRGQLEGETLDLDAAIAMLIERRRGLRSEPRLFIRPGRGKRPLSLILLVDLSRSTNDIAPGATQSVLDREKSAAIMLARTAIECGHRVAIHGFSSNTRACVNYFRLLDFGQKMETSVEQAVLSLNGQFSTRIGTAFRHAGSFLLGEACQHRAILAVTDGEPSDIDVYDRNYLLEDAREAVQEISRRGIRTYGAVVDGGAADYARRIFGYGNFCIADSSEVLPARLSTIYARIVSN
ncbi:hypothetical protein D9M68_265170 [compost metagenome]